MDEKLIMAAQDAGRRCGAYLTSWMAAEIIMAVLGKPDGEYHTKRDVSPEIWDREDARKSIRASMRHSMATSLMDEGLVPLTMPREVVTGPSPREPWGMMTIELVVAARKPPDLRLLVTRANGRMSEVW